MSWTPAHTALRNALSYLYDERASARRIAKDAGVRTTKVTFSNNAELNWQLLIEEAEKQGKLTALIEKAQAEYPGDTELAAAAAQHALADSGLKRDTSNDGGEPDGLSGEQYRQIERALLAAFNVNTLARMLRSYLEPAVQLDHITSEQIDFPTIVYKTIRWAEQAGRVDELVAAAKRAQPSNQKVQDLPAAYGTHAALPAQSAVATDDIRLTKPRNEIAGELKQQITRGEILLAQAPPKTEGELDTQSSQWHQWRRYSEQLLRDSFSTRDQLDWLRQLIPGNQDFTKPWPERAAALRKDVSQELAFLRNLLAKLDNYPLLG